MEIAILGRRQTVLGFKLAGAGNAVIASENKNELLDQFDALASREEIGLIAVDDSCSEIHEHLIRFIEENRKPMVIEIPSQKGTPAEGLLESITKSATGAK